MGAEAILTHKERAENISRIEFKHAAERHENRSHAENLAMSLPLPDIPESECTPLVRQLLDIVQQQQEIIQQLRR